MMRNFVFSSFLAIAIFALTPVALAAQGEDAPFGTILTEGDSSNTREQSADTRSHFQEAFVDQGSHFQETFVDQVADEDPLDSINRTPDEGKSLSAYDKAIKWLEAHFKFTERSIRDIADVLERAANVAKKAEGSELRNHLISNFRSGLPVPRSIWGVTVFDLSSSRRAPSDEPLDDESTDAFDVQLTEFNAVLKTYANPETLFPRANGDPASMVDFKLDPRTGALHACVHFLRKLSIVRQLAQVAFPSIEIADVPPPVSSQHSLGQRVRSRLQRMFQGRAPDSIGVPDYLSPSRSLEIGRAYEPQGSATTAIDISENVVRWVRSLADNVRAGFDQILQTERKDQDLLNNKERLIERVKNANMMVRALRLYTSGVSFHPDVKNDNSTTLWQLVLRLSEQELPLVKVLADALDRSYDITMESLDRMRSFWDDFAVDEDKDAPDEGDKWGGFKDDVAADEEFFVDRFPNEGDDFAADDEILDATDRFPNEGEGDLAVSRIMTEDELADNGELRINFNNRKLARLLAHKFKTRPHSDKQIREAIRTEDGHELYLMVICPVCHDSMHSKTLATPICGHGIHKQCLEAAENVCPICRRNPNKNDKKTLKKKAQKVLEDVGMSDDLLESSGSVENEGELFEDQDVRHKGPHENTNVETLLKKLLKLFEDEGVIPKCPKREDPKKAIYLRNAKDFLEAYFKTTAWIIQRIARKLERTAALARFKDFSFFERSLRFHRTLGIRERIPRAILGVTAFGWDHTPRDQSYDTPVSPDYGINVLDMEFSGLCLNYANPGALFRLANGDFASMDDVKRNPKRGARHARVHFLRELSIVRQLAQVAFPNISIAKVPPLKNRADISKSVVSWVHSLAGNVLAGLDQILKTESLSSSNKEKLIERVQNTNMMVQALTLYTGPRNDYSGIAAILQNFLRRPGHKVYTFILSLFHRSDRDRRFRHAARRLSW